jgi:hypothetical protein
MKMDNDLSETFWHDHRMSNWEERKSFGVNAHKFPCVQDHGQNARIREEQQDLAGYDIEFTYICSQK